ncbi:MAG: ADP-ribosylation/crystallin J1 [Gemmataceae bacterium]|nr:ADP-ribosylation/crystallin J1 [Gemmataceae bacterium]
MRLYRPVGVRELELIAEAGWRAFPPRLSTQPIFYPVLTREYAVSIALEWNTGDAASGYAGFVTEFDVEDEYAARFEAKRVGATGHLELWVPSAELAEFNDHLLGPIRVTEARYGPRFAGTVDEATGLPASVAPLPPCGK